MKTTEKMENNVFIKVESFNNINSKIVKQNINLKCLTETDSIGIQHVIRKLVKFVLLNFTHNSVRASSVIEESKIYLKIFDI
jgi:hypothetical protein